jgi:hypothetical protein
MQSLFSFDFLGTTCTLIWPPILLYKWCCANCSALANFSQFVAFLFGIFPRSLFIFVWLATDFMRSGIVGPVILLAANSAL